ncbi:hypothetical protein ACIBK8_24945 [Streptomyces sp. NPDC050161]|uniref:hypothetical protein n=1 Tax=Streptomyces sp. NPDC050161 TaxID=3365604 RepID=UPI0037A7C283
MSELPAELFRQWTHSYEEDAEGVTVYRPVGYPFPPARGRRGMEIVADGTYIDHAIGAADVPDIVPGRWSTADGRSLDISFPGTDRPVRRLEILQCDGELLTVRAS